MTTHRTTYWHKLEDGRVQCDVCPRECRLHEGQCGFCFVRACEGGEIVLTTYAMAGIKKEDMGNASAIYNLLRNLGGSFGVAFVTTILARRAQFHQTRLVEPLTPFDRDYPIFSGQSSQFLEYRGVESSLSEQGGLGIMYKELLRQSSMLSFNDAFYLVCIMMICILPLVFLMRRGQGMTSAGMH